MRSLILTLTLGILTACGPVVVSTNAPSKPQASQPQTSRQVLSNQEIVRNFNTVKARMEPVMERICREGTQGLKCDFLIGVDENPNAPPNAFQTLNRDGRPVIIFTETLLKKMRNIDELAFVMGHEGAHHIANHLGRQRTAANAGAIILGQIASAAGVKGQGLETAQKVGQTVGARTFSKEFELEADRLGTRITHAAGFDPVRGAAFFSQIPDPGDRFLGSHPPNAARVQAVRETAATL